MSVLGMIRRTFPFVDVDGFKLLYNVYIRSHLELLGLVAVFQKDMETVWRKCSVGQQIWFMVLET